MTAHMEKITMKFRVVISLTLGLLTLTSSGRLAAEHPAQPTVPPSVAFLEPLTVLQGAAAVLSIANTLFGGGDTKDIKNKLNEISGKLDFVIQRQDTILAEIISLRVYFNEAMRASFEKEARIDFIALKDRFNVALAAKTNSGQIASLTPLRSEAERVAFRMKEYGPASYQTAFAAASVLAAINYRIGVPRAQRRVSMRTISDKFAQWLEPTGPESVPQVRDQAVAQQLVIEKTIADFPRFHRWTVRTVKNGRCEADIFREVRIDGDLEHGFTATHNDVQGKWSCEPGECRKCLVLADLNAVAAPYLDAIKPLSRFRSMRALVGSGLPPLDAIQGMREQWQRQVEQVARLEAIIANIDVARKAIDRWGDL